jgi:hypothetical protein
MKEDGAQRHIEHLGNVPEGDAISSHRPHHFNVFVAVFSGPRHLVSSYISMLIY